MDKSIDLVIFLSEDPGMIRVGSHTLDAIDQGLLKGMDIRIDRRIGLDSHRFSLFDQFLNIGGRFERCRAFGKIDLALRCLDLFLQIVSQCGAPVNELNEPGRIKVHVCQGGEHGFRREDVYFPFGHPDFAALDRKQGQPLEGIDEKILEGRHVGLLAADPHPGASLSLCRLFTLVTEHNCFPPS